MALSLFNRKNSSPAIPFFSLLFVCFACAILGDSTAESLILSRFDASVIPNMYLVNALFLFFTSLALMSIIDKVDRGVFFFCFLLIHGAVLLIIWIAVTLGISFLYVPLFSYAYITKIFLFLMFWTLANDVIDSRKAGKVFPVIAAGGTLGAVMISFSIPWLLKLVSAQHLLLLWSVLVIGMGILFLPVQRTFGRSFMQRHGAITHQKSRGDVLVSGLSLLYREPLLANMSILYFLIFFALLNQHYIFYKIIKMRFIHADALAGFLGYFNGISMMVTFLLQTTIAGFVIRRIGSTRSMFLLPLVFCVVFGMLSLQGNVVDVRSSTGELVSPVFWIVVIGVGLRMAFFDSFFSPNFQIFFSSLPSDIRGKGKLVIEGVVKPAAMILTSVWLLVVAQHVSFSTTMIVLFCASVLMIVQTFRIRTKYTESLTQYLADFRSRGGDNVLNVKEMLDHKSVVSLLKEMLYKEEDELQRYSIELLSHLNSDETITILVEYFPLANSKVQSAIVTALGNTGRKELKSFFVKLLDDADTRIVANAIEAIGTFHDPHLRKTMQKLLMHPNNRVRANVIAVLWSGAEKPLRAELCSTIRQMLDAESDRMVASGLFALKMIDDQDSIGELTDYFYNQKKGRISDTLLYWDNFLKLIKKWPSPRYIELLLQLSTGISGKKRKDIVSTIREACRNGYSTATLMAMLETQTALVIHLILEVFCTGDFKFSKNDNEKLITGAVREYEYAEKEKDASEMFLQKKDNDAFELLAVSIKEESVYLHLWNLIYIAAIQDKSGRIKTIMRRLVHENKHVRARALEVLDNAGNARVNRMVIHLLENQTPSGAVSNGHRGNAGKEEVKEVIERYISHENALIRECAFYALASLAS
jgi:HEAT repeat protein